jgi:hypothetical protein
MINPRHVQRALLLGGVLLALTCGNGCAPVLPQAQLLPCQKSRAEIMEAARQGLVSAGFSIKRYLPDSGYIRTSAKRIQTVNEISNGRPTLIVVEAQHTPAGLNVLAWRLVAIKGSVADRTAAFDEDSADMEEVQLMAGERLHIFHVGPFLDHMTAFCTPK